VNGDDLEVRQARAEGRSVEDAMAKAAEALGLPVERVRFFVVDRGAPGFLGLGRRPAVVIGQALVPVEPLPLPGHERRDAGGRGRPQGGTKAPRRPGEAGREVPARAPEAGGTETPAAQPAEGAVWHEGARSFVEGFVRTLGMPAEVTATVEDGELVVRAQGNFDWFLQGRSEALENLQFLGQLAVTRQSQLRGERARFTIDLGDFRERRLGELRELARRTAEKVRASGRPVRLEAMSSSERRIIHVALQEEEGIVTRSEGQEPHRHVVVLPARGGKPRNGREVREGKDVGEEREAGRPGRGGGPRRRRTGPVVPEATPDDVGDAPPEAPGEGSRDED
jgi:spoIIIJ-associated protein